MNRETKLIAIILKKQPFKEGDEIITFFTKEQGKVRAIAKSIKFSKSKLQQRLQNLFLVNLILSTGGLPKIISVEPIEAFLRMRESLDTVKVAYYATELILKFTPDGQKNEKLFNLFLNFLRFLDSENTEKSLAFGLARFKMDILTASGLNISTVAFANGNKTVYFSPSQGGFVYTKPPDAIMVSRKACQDYLNLMTDNFTERKNFEDNIISNELQSLLSFFIEYQLERKIKSEKYLKQ